MNIRTLCLGILYFRDATGYEINKTVSEGNFSHFIMASYGSIYPTLSKLEADGLVFCREETEAGKPTRKVYSINDLGRAALIDAISDEPRGDIFKSEFLFLCLCSELLQPAYVTTSINQQIDRLSSGLDCLQVARAECGHKQSEFVIDYGISLHQAGLDYLLANRHRLENLDDSEADGNKDCDPLSAQAAE